MKYSPSLGWTIRENGANGVYKANSSGIRSDKEYSLTPPHNVLRISTFGNSFTHCDDVANDETWQTFLSDIDSDIEVINFGVGAYGTDQAYLRYLENGIKYKSHIIFIGFMSENIFRNVNTFRPFYKKNCGPPLTKPRFIIQDESLLLIKNPMRKIDDYNRILHSPREIHPLIGVHDFYYANIQFKHSAFDFSPTVRLFKIVKKKLEKVTIKDPAMEIIVNGYYNETSEAFQVTKKIFDAFCQSVIKNNSIPIILIFPRKHEIIRYQEQKTKQYSPLLSYFDFKGYQYIDLLNAFVNYIEDHDVNNLII